MGKKNLAALAAFWRSHYSDSLGVTPSLAHTKPFCAGVCAGQRPDGACAAAWKDNSCDAGHVGFPADVSTQIRAALVFVPRGDARQDGPIHTFFFNVEGDFSGWKGLLSKERKKNLLQAGPDGRRPCFLSRLRNRANSPVCAAMFIEYANEPPGIESPESWEPGASREPGESAGPESGSVWGRGGRRVPKPKRRNRE